VHFLLGYERARATARRHAVSYRTGTGFDPALERNFPREDWALVTLDKPIDGPVLPLLRRPLAPRTALMLAGYQQDRPEVLLADTGCRLLDARDGVLVHDCAGTRGSSGGPVLTRSGQGWAVVGVASRAAREMALGQAVAVEMLPTSGSAER
jgi:protease YdgD